MSQSKMDVVHDLNTLLEGCHMGASTFHDYLEQTQAISLKTVLNNALMVFRKHEIALNHHLEALNEDSEEEIKLGSIMAEFFEKIKAQMATDDRQLLDYATRGIDMGLKACQDFKKKHEHLHHDLLQSINELEKDYKKIYQNLIDLKLDQD